MSQLTQQHESLFKQALQAVDSHGTRQALGTLWDILREALGVVEVVVPAATPVLDAVQRAGTFAGKDVDEMEAYIAKMQAQLAKMKAQAAPEPPSA